MIDDFIRLPRLEWQHFHSVLNFTWSKKYIYFPSRNSIQLSVITVIRRIWNWEPINKNLGNGVCRIAFEINSSSFSLVASAVQYSRPSRKFVQKDAHLMKIKEEKVYCNHRYANFETRIFLMFDCVFVSLLT